MGKEKNIGMAAICYLGILVLIPMLTDAKKDPFVKFHVKQGLVLLITGVIISAVGAIPILGRLVAIVGGMIVFVLFIMGLVNALGGKEVKLPIIGQYADKINI